MSESDPAVAWAEMVDGLRVAGERMDALAAGVPAGERADGFRALARALNNQLGRFEVDRQRPEFVPFNGWREKFLMDNPDFRYWVADISDDVAYRIVGTVGGAVYTSITAYAAAGIADAAATARVDSDTLDIDADGRFELVLSRVAPADGSPWLEMPAGATAVWARFFHLDAADDVEGQISIEPLEIRVPPAFIDPPRFEHRLRTLGSTMATVPRIIGAAAKSDLATPNSVRHWSEMTGGAAFTEPAIHYLRGSWELGPDDALVIEGPLVECRFWNVLLYSRYLNSLDARHRTVSRTAARSTVAEGRYRFVLAAHDPGPDAGLGDFLDTEGRPFGIFVLRFLQPVAEPELPSVTVVRG